MEKDRLMPFGKYKGQYVTTLIAENPKYIDWMAKNTSFVLSDDEKKLLSQKLASLSNRSFKRYRFNNSQTALEAFGNILDRNVLGENYSEDYFDDYNSSTEKEIRSGMRLVGNIPCSNDRAAEFKRVMEEQFRSPSYDEMFPDFEYW